MQDLLVPVALVPDGIRQWQDQESDRMQRDFLEASTRMQQFQMPIQMVEPLQVLPTTLELAEVTLLRPLEPIRIDDSAWIQLAVLRPEDLFRRNMLAAYEFLPCHPIVNVWAWILTGQGLTEEDLRGMRPIHGRGEDPAVTLQLAARTCIEGCSGDAATRARSWLEPACDAGASLACYAAARLPAPVLNGRPARTQAQFQRLARKGFEAGCRLGDPIDCYGLGVQQEMGEGGSLDLAAASMAYRQACLLGYAPGCRAQGRVALDPDGLPLAEDKMSRLQERATTLSRSAGLDDYGLHWGADEEEAPSESLQKDDSDLCAEGHAAACYSEAVSLAQSGDENDADRARELLTSPCDGGMPQACHNLAVLLVYEDGMDGGHARDPAKARELYGRACDEGLAVACHGLGTLLMRGPEKDMDLAKALSLDRIACEGGSAGGCYDVAVLLQQKESRAGNGRDMETWLRRSCDLRLPLGCLKLANLLQQEPTTTERLSEARNVLERSCRQDLGSGCTLLGYFWDYGIGGSMLETRARELYQKACDLGDAAGCNNLGVCNRFGQGGPTNRAEAIRLFEQACEGDIPDGCRNRAEIEFDSAKSTADKARARFYFERACSARDPGGCLALAGMLYHGEGGYQDRPQARDLFLRNCADGHVESCRTAGYFWSSGDAGAVDLLQAEKSLQKACNAEDGGACADLAEVRSRPDMPSDSRRRVPEGYRKARNLMEKACAEGDGDACVEASDLWREGRGGSADSERGDALLADACRAGSGEGCLRLARLAEARPALNNEGAAIRRYLAAACEIGHAEGCLHLGAALWMGWWGVMDRDRARTHLADACRYGAPRSCGVDAALNLLDAVSQWMTRLRPLPVLFRTIP